jgi:hypothetical protein
VAFFKGFKFSFIIAVLAAAAAIFFKDGFLSVLFPEFLYLSFLQ